MTEPMQPPHRQSIYQSPVTGVVPFRASFKSHKNCSDHWHSEIEIFYLMPASGPITVYIEGEPYPLRGRDMLVVPSAAVHRIEVSKADNQVLRLDIGYPLLGENFRPFTERRFTNPRYCFADGDNPKLDAIEPLLHAIRQEKAVVCEGMADSSDLDTVISRMRVSALLLQIAAALLEAMPSAAVSASDAKKRYALQIVQTVIFYIRDHYSEPITLAKAADMAGYEKTHFCRLFKEIVGVTFHQYITRRRMEAAIELLRDTELSVTSIAQSVGIPSVKTFSRLMNAHCGLPPKEIRRHAAEQRDKQT